MSDNIQLNISTQLRNARQQFPEHFRKHIHTLATVEDNASGQWEKRLREAKENQIGERITLIPYHFKDLHWIGILLEFKADEQIERAEFIDPVQRSKFVPDRLQKQLTVVYPDVILRARNLQKHDDIKLSASLTVSNLIEAAKVSNDHKTTTFIRDDEQLNKSKEEPSVPKPFTFQGNESTRDDLELRVKNELARLKIRDTSDLEENIQQTGQRIDEYEEEERVEEVKMETQLLSELRSLQILMKQLASISENRLPYLEEKLSSELKKRNIQELSKLSERIQRIEQRIKDYQIKQRTVEAEREAKILTELQDLQKLAEEINVLKNKSTPFKESNESRLQFLKQKVNDLLIKLGLQDASKLSEEMQEAKNRISDYEEEGRSEEAEEEKNVLTDLLQLETLVNEINKLTFSSTPLQRNNNSEIKEESNSNIPINEESNNNIPINEEYSVTEENLRNLYIDFSSMPSCIERSIISLLFYVSLKLVGNVIAFDGNIKIPEKIEMEMLTEIECLEKRLKIEELQSAEIDNSVHTVRLHIRNENWKCALTELKQFFAQICPLNIHELFRLIKKVDDAAHLIQDKNIILFLGGTGSGKSTTIHFLAGSEMVETRVDGLNHITPAVIKNPELKKITTSPYARSETRYITPVTVNYEDVNAYANGSIILCDSPGFEDTSGPEVDIANGIGIVKAIRGCRSVKPVVLISYKSIGDRCEGLKDLTHTLVGFIPDIQDQIRAFSYIFTKYPLNERDTIHASLVNIKRTMNDAEKLDISFVNFFGDMLHKTEDRQIVIDPIKGKPGKILYDLAQSTVIQRPGDVFHFSITKQSKAAVNEQLRKHQLTIISAVKRFEYELIKYKLDQLKYLNELLCQDDIKLVYNDCVRHINKHLSEQYEESISAIHNSIVNQIVLSDENIEQYQTRINHAKLSEELRNEHLGKDAVHCSAFIQYLNQQITIMLDNLREKNINDSSVKVSLDKSKRLLESFPDLNYEKYETVCRVFIEKVELVVTSFQNSVLTNNFDQSASDISKLSDALTILQGHLTSEDIEKKYIELKKYFVKYLNDSTEKLSHIFNKENLIKSDIDSLNDCVCMLESANKTFALQPHIPKEAINEVYENLLTKIINYFKVIINKIHTQLKNENAFQVLEQYMTELDLIRTILTIELKTTQSYFSTLEELIGYVRRSGEIVEEQLRILFRREGKVDYDKLIKYFSSLKSAKWIEKYRSGVYSDVINNVEQKLIEHIKGLKETVMEVHLDLDNFEKIEPAYKLISEINEMKPIERIVDGISEHINEVNSWFINVTNEVFTIIKETFNVEKWNGQGSQTLDFNKAEKGFYYLRACKNIRILYKSGCMSVSNSLEEFVRSYSQFVHKEMEACFEKIKQYENTNKDELFDEIKQYDNKVKEDIFEKARIFTNRLREISEIKATYPCIFSYFFNKKIIEEWQDQLSNYLIEFSDEMAKLTAMHKAEALNTKLSVAKALSKLDSFLVDKKYIDLFNKYQNIFHIQTSDVLKQVLDAIKNNDYEQVLGEMLVLQSSSDIGEHFFRQAKRALNAGLVSLMEETRHQTIMLGNNIEKDEINGIVENLKRIRRAKQFVLQFLDEPNEIDKCIEEVKILIQERIIRFVDGVEALITINNFYEADKKIDSITLVRTLLGNYCTEVVVKKIDKLKEHQNKVVLVDVVNIYSQMDISGYTMNPPTDIFARFGQANNINPIYNQALTSIKEKILSKFREELDKARLVQPPNPANSHIRKCESAVKYLPETMKNALEIELKHCTDDIDLVIRDNDANLAKAFSNGDIKNIKNILEEYQKSEGMVSYMNKGRELVLKLMRDIATKIIHHLDKDEIIEAFDSVKKLNEYKVELENIVGDPRQIYFEVRSRIKMIFHEAYNCFMNRFLNTDTSVITKDIIDTTEKSFICLVEFLKLQSQYKDDQSIVKNMLPEDFAEKTIALNKRISQYLNELQNKYKDALKNLDITSLKESLGTVKQWNSIFIKMKNCDIHSIDDPSVNTTVKAITEVISYPQMLEGIGHRFREFRDELITQDLINKDTKEFVNKRNEFYRKLNEKYSILIKARIFDTYSTNIEINKLEQECFESLRKKITEICFFAETFAEKFSSDINLSRQDYDNFNLHYNNLISFQEEMKINDFEIYKKIEKIEKKLFDKIQLWEKLIDNETTIENIANSLIDMKRASNNILSLKIKINERIDIVVNRYKFIKKQSADFGKLGTVLNQDKTGIGQTIIYEHNAFQGYSLSMFNEKTQRHGIDYVVNNLEGDLTDHLQLKTRFEEFHKIYRDLITQYLKPNLELEKLILDIKLIAGNAKQTSKSIVWDGGIKAKIPKLTAHIFALWTLQNSTHYFEAEGAEKRESYLRQPHAAQIISIFRMLGIGDKKEELKNNLVQIGTGEGKSVTLGATACILALLGFDIHCACYSEYLSERDYTAFLPLFDSLGLLTYIHYGTFNKLCEDMINENGNIRETIEELIYHGSNNTTKNNQQIKRAKILLIDEVDVFFSKDFYGSVYTPAACLRDPTITSLINFIWAQRKSKLNLNQVKSAFEYTACCNRFPNWKILIDEAIKDMLSDINNYQSHDYIVNQDKIGYKELDNISYNITYGYKTLFAYYCEHEKGKITKESLEENISILIKCGSFSYAEIPLAFTYIMGVTGTLKTLSDPEKHVVRNKYKVSKNTYTPSVFGKNSLKFTEKDDIMIENSDDYFNVIRREIDDRLAGKSSEKRAVLVFFESKQKLKEFYESKALEPIKESVVYLTEEALIEEKESLIKRATSSGQITLFTRTFGRGTDFICYDQNVLASGGAHVIQTFLSEEVSEEVQIKGRTARQGENGSYSMVLLDLDLEKFQIERTDIEDVKKGKGVRIHTFDTLPLNNIYDTVYDLLNDKRTKLFKIQYDVNMKYVEQAKERHTDAQKFLLDLNSRKTNSVKDFLVKENRGVGGVLSSRTVCLMDATGSMTHLLHKCKNTVDIMFERASEILKDNKINSDTFQIQFVVYRNYNSQEDKILQSSPWETRPDNLRAFMNMIEVEGGWGNEAIEIGLWHANKENEREKITQVILIGDAPPNTQHEIQIRREKFGENYWQQTKFAQSTYYEHELARLISNQIPVHAFYVAQSAEASFQAIASRSGGRCEMLDINSALGSKMLTDLVTEEILRNIGGISKGDALVQAYRKRFTRA